MIGDNHPSGLHPRSDPAGAAGSADNVGIITNVGVCVCSPLLKPVGDQEAVGK